MQSQELTWPGCACSRAHLQEHRAVDLWPSKHQDGHCAGVVRRPGEAPFRLAPPAWRHQCAAAGGPRRCQVPVPQVCGEGCAARRLHYRCMPLSHLYSSTPCHVQPKSSGLAVPCLAGMRNTVMTLLRCIELADICLYLVGEWVPGVAIID